MRNFNFPFLLRLLFVLTLAISLSCNEKAKKQNVISKTTEQTAEINSFFTITFAEIVKDKHEVKLSEFAEDVKLVQLENIPEAMLGNVENIEFTKDYVFVKFWQHPVLQFSRLGKYLRDIGAKGKGPGEYDTCFKMSVDEANEKIYIHSLECGILVFSFEGRHLKTFSYPAQQRYLNIWARDSFMVSYFEPIMGDEPFVFIEHNEQGDTLQAISNYILYDENEQVHNLSPFEEQNYTYRFENKLHMKGCYNDTVYTYDKNNKIIPKYFIDLGKHKLPPEFIYERKWKRPLPDNLYWTGVHETSNFIFIPYGYHFDMNKPNSKKEERACILYNKKTKKGLAVEETKQGGFVDDITGGPDFRPIVTNDNTAIMLVSALDMKLYLDSEQFKNQEVKLPEEKEKLNQLNRTLKEDDNHFLVVMKVKN